MLSEPELAYLAAVIDTRARIKTIDLSSGSVIPSLAISGPDVDLLQYLGDLTGMAAFMVRRTYLKHRCTEHCPERHEYVQSETARWSITGAKATIILAAVLPYMRFQRELAEEVLAIGLDAPHKKPTVTKMKRLGWPLPDEWNSN